MRPPVSGVGQALQGLAPSILIYLFLLPISMQAEMAEAE